MRVKSELGTHVSAFSTDMRLFGIRFRVSESAKRNLYMAPGVMLIAGVLIGDACSKSGRSQAASDEAPRMVHRDAFPSEGPRLVNAETSVKREASFRIK